jgi:hypothetical protein
MSEHGDERSDQSEEDGPLSVSDDQLPEDLRADDDHPLAQPAGDDVPADILKDTSEKRPLEEGDDSGDDSGDTGSASDTGGDTGGDTGEDTVGDTGGDTGEDTDGEADGHPGSDSDG